jgi:hypothetical protein
VCAFQQEAWRSSMSLLQRITSLPVPATPQCGWQGRRVLLTTHFRLGLHAVAGAAHSVCMPRSVCIVYQQNDMCVQCMCACVWPVHPGASPSACVCRVTFPVRRSVRMAYFCPAVEHVHVWQRALVHVCHTRSGVSGGLLFTSTCPVVQVLTGLRCCSCRCCCSYL